MRFNLAIKALIEENTQVISFLIIEGYQEYFIIIHLYKQGSLFYKMSVRGPQGQNPRTTCGPRTTVWKTLHYTKLVAAFVSRQSRCHILARGNRWPMSPRAGSGPSVEFFSGPAARADPLKIFTLNRKDWLSAAKWIGLGMKWLIFTIDT
jgi:hypothetical protein